MTDFNAMVDALVSCDTDKVTGLVNDALAENIAAADILNKGLIAAIEGLVIFVIMNPLRISW